MKNIVVIGYFGGESEHLGGQSIKTNTIYNALIKYAEYNCIKIDTYKWKNNPIKLIYNIIKSTRYADAVIMLPARGGVKILAPLLARLHKKNKFKLLYSVIGGWLPDLLSNKPKLKISLKKFDKILVETQNMATKLKKVELNNIYVVPNFKDLPIVSKNEISRSYKCPFKLCTFSRVMKEKGIEEAIDVVNNINDEMKCTYFTLDIYGQVQEGYEEWFLKLKNKFNNNIRYCGEVNYLESVNTLKKYFLLLFPTFYEGEGFAGTIIDAFSAGLPVVASDWKYNSEIIENDKTGYVFPVHDLSKLKLILVNLAKNLDKLYDLKLNCIEKAEGLSAEKMIQKYFNF